MLLGWLLVCVAALVFCAVAACAPEGDTPLSARPVGGEGGAQADADRGAEQHSDATSGHRPDRSAERRAMVERHLRERGIADARVLAALAAVPRERFVPDELAARAYDDGPLPIGHEQTISQPYIVARMTEALALQPGEKVLEIGTGSGYQAAVLARITPHVFTIEIVAPLAERAAALLSALGYTSISCRTGDGYQGWPEQAPFDAILVTAAPDHVPPALLEQLAPGGRLCLPVGDQHETQELLLFERDAEGRVHSRRLDFVRFVPMTGAAQEPGR